MTSQHQWPASTSDQPAPVTSQHQWPAPVTSQHHWPAISSDQPAPMTSTNYQYYEYMNDHTNDQHQWLALWTFEWPAWLHQWPVPMTNTMNNWMITPVTHTNDQQCEHTNDQDKWQALWIPMTTPKTSINDRSTSPCDCHHLSLCAVVSVKDRHTYKGAVNLPSILTDCHRLHIVHHDSGWPQLWHCQKVMVLMIHPHFSIQ